MKINRRTLLLSAGSFAIAGLVGYRRLKSHFIPQKLPGIIQGANFAKGHLIRDPKFDIRQTLEVKIESLIIGAGVSGLSTAYHLKAKGYNKFQVLDLENEVGGNARAGSQGKSRYPLGAHYLPLPNSDMIELKDFLTQAGVIEVNDSDRPKYNEYHLCFDPNERLFIHGRWQEGLEPSHGLNNEDHDQLERFFRLMDHFKMRRGRDGKMAFTIPIDNSSQDRELLSFDDITMAEFMQAKSFTSEYLLWYVNYCCLDDFGADATRVSAWAGIHYFAARKGQAQNGEEGSMLTWPEGNAFLVKHLAADLNEHFNKGELVYQIEKKNSDYQVFSYHFEDKRQTIYRTKNIVYAAPEFTAKKIVKIPELNKKLMKREKEYAPWMTANIELNKTNLDNDIPLCWDNVNYHGESLGYIYAEHQEVARHHDVMNLTMYWPLTKPSTQLARIKALTTTHQEWCNQVLSELKLVHPHIESHVRRIDVALWGHAMAIPKPGFLKQKALDSDNFIFAHTDQAGVSIFEEGFYQGIKAAQRVLSL